MAVNHQSYADPPMIAAAVPRVLHFFAKQELFGNIFLRAVISWFNAIPVRRGVYDPEALRRASDILNKGGALMFFPEGTRGDGNRFLPPKPGIGMVARRARVPIVPAYARGTSRLKEAFFRRKRLTVIMGKPLTPEEIDTYDNDKTGYLALAEDVMSRIRKLRETMPNGVQANEERVS